MKTTLLSVLCLFISGWGSMQTALAQNLQEMEKSLSAINEELNQKTKEYSCCAPFCFGACRSRGPICGNI